MHICEGCENISKRIFANIPNTQYKLQEIINLVKETLIKGTQIMI